MSCDGCVGNGEVAACPPSLRERGSEGRVETRGSTPVGAGRRMRCKSAIQAEAAIFGIILTIWSNMLQNEAAACHLGGKPCVQRIAALRYFRYSESKELAITIFVSSALLLPALLHRTDNTPPPSCQSGSRARRTSSRVGLFSFLQVCFFQVEVDQLPMRATPVLPLSQVHLIVLAPARSSSKHIGLPLFQLWNF